jgi:hypothetical protein
MSVKFPFWIGQVDAESLPPWCGVVMLATIVVGILFLVVVIVKEWRK